MMKLELLSCHRVVSAYYCVSTVPLSAIFHDVGPFPAATTKELVVDLVGHVQSIMSVWL